MPENTGASVPQSERHLNFFQGFLHGAVEGLFTHALKRQVDLDGLHVKREHLIRGLLTAQTAGEVAFRGRRWRDSFWEISGKSIAGGESEYEPSGEMKGFLEGIPVDVIAGTSPVTDDDGLAESVDDGSADWELFRKLLPHYIECLRLANATSLSQVPERHGRQFHILRPFGRWWPDDAGSRFLRISKEALGGDFIEGLSRRQHDPLLLGYPLSIFHTEAGESFIYPVGLLQCGWSIDNVALTLWPTETAPRLNPDWVRGTRERRRLRKITQWLEDNVTRDDGLIHSIRQETGGDVPDLAGTLMAFLQGERKDRLDPGHLSTRLDLDRHNSIQNVLGLFLVGQNSYTQGAREDLQKLREWSEEDLSATALSSLFGNGATQREEVPVVSPLPLSEDQFVAVRDALGSPLTVISGPPGTGKSQVVVAIMVSAAMAGRSVLFASRTHQAIDAVQIRLQDLYQDRDLLARAWSGVQSDSFDFKNALNSILARHVDSKAREILGNKQVDLHRVGTQINSILEKTDALTQFTEIMGELNAEKSARGSNIEETRNKKYPSLIYILSSFLYKLLRLFRLSINTSNKNSYVQKNRFLSDFELVQKLIKAETEHRARLKELGEITSGTSMPSALDDLCKKSKDLLPDLANALESSDAEEREKLVELLGNLGLASSADSQRALWRVNASLILRHFPLWACSILATPRRIPQVSGLFDYLVIDEATTSDIASALPLFARARNAVIVGDKMQTGLISDLGGGREKELLDRAGLSDSRIGRFSFSQVSIFDLASSSLPARHHILRDHFRCHEDIADYFSETFYGGRLFVRTDEKSLKIPNNFKPGFHWTDVVGPIDTRRRGCRSQSEAEGIAKHLFDLLENGKYEGTVGVVTPFKQQKDLIIHLVEQRLSRERIDASQLRVGTSHAFQGSDRDTIIVSLCMGPEMPRGAAWFMRDSRQLINVAISRAKAVCHVFGNREYALNCKIPHISNLARRIGARKRPGHATEPVFESPWQRILYEALRKKGVTPITEYPLAGRRLDLAIVKGEIQLDVEVDGDTYHRDPDGFRKVSDIWRDHVIESVGWKVRRFWVYELREDLEGCVERVLRDLE